MRDVEKVLLLCPMHKKAHMRRLRLMYALGCTRRAHEWWTSSRTLFPAETEFIEKMKLDMDKAAAMESKSCVVCHLQDVQLEQCTSVRLHTENVMYGHLVFILMYV